MFAIRNALHRNLACLPAGRGGDCSSHGGVGGLLKSLAAFSEQREQSLTIFSKHRGSYFAARDSLRMLRIYMHKKFNRKVQGVPQSQAAANT